MLKEYKQLHFDLLRWDPFRANIPLSQEPVTCVSSDSEFDDPNTTMNWVESDFM